MKYYSRCVFNFSQKKKKKKSTDKFEINIFSQKILQITGTTPVFDRFDNTVVSLFLSTAKKKALDEI